MITVAALNPSLDLTYLLDSVMVGRIQRTADVLRVAGGKSLNLARAATTMGTRCAVVALLGGETGHQLARMVRAEGMELTVIEAETETRICVSLACASTGELTEAYQDAAAVPASVLADFVATAERALLVHHGWLALAGRAPAGAHEVVGELVRLGHLCGHRVAVDTHGEALAYAVEQQPDLVKINRIEAAQLLDRPPEDDLRVMAAALAARTGGWVVLTDGMRGAVSVNGAEVLRVDGLAVRGHFPVGSGDSFLGGLLAALDAQPEDQPDLVAALRAGAGCAAANAMVPGQGRLDRGLAERMAAQTRVFSEALAEP